MSNKGPERQLLHSNPFTFPDSGETLGNKAISFQCLAFYEEEGLAGPNIKQRGF